VWLGSFKVSAFAGLLLFRVSEVSYRSFKIPWHADGQYLVRSARRRARLNNYTKKCRGLAETLRAGWEN
jgi:hypothetical protein